MDNSLKPISDDSDGLNGFEGILHGFSHLFRETFGGEDVLDFSFIELFDADIALDNKPADQHVNSSQGDIHVLGQIPLVAIELRP